MNSKAEMVYQTETYHQLKEIYDSEIWLLTHIMSINLFVCFFTTLILFSICQILESDYIRRKWMKKYCSSINIKEEVDFRESVSTQLI